MQDMYARRKKFGEWFSSCRKQARVTQAELAHALGLESPQLISNVERGMSLIPSGRLTEIARVLGCSLLELEVRYFSCSARNSSESRMPDLLLKYLPLLELLEYGPDQGPEAEARILSVIKAIREA